MSSARHRFVLCSTLDDHRRSLDEALGDTYHASMIF